jgi:nickel-dependent lactate racemase
MTVRIAYGANQITADLDWGRHLATVDIADVPALAGGAEALRAAIDSPIGGGPSIFDIVQRGERVLIITSDSFRSTGSDTFLPVLVAGLNAAGVPDSAISFLSATGTHRPPTESEWATILSADLFGRFKDRCFVNDAHAEGAHRHVGDTSRGTPVYIDKRAFEADRVIVTGSVVLHYFGGFGGGRKAVVPGIASVETISRNHSMNLDPHEDRLDPNVAIGKMAGNPVAEDMLEATTFLPVDYLVNTVLNRQGRIAGIFAGDLEQAHGEACAFAEELFAVPLEEQADVVIASSGPIKNFVQTHKALFNAYQAVKPEGRIIMLAQCPEGLGGDQFVKWLRLGSREAIIAGLRDHAEINGQTALSTTQKAPITTFVTDLSEDDVALLGGRKAPSLEDALALVRRELQGQGIDDPTYYTMPSAAYTVPLVTRAQV